MVMEAAPAGTDCEMRAGYMAVIRETLEEDAAVASKRLSQPSSSSPSSPSFAFADINRASPPEKHGSRLNCGSTQQSKVSQSNFRSQVDTALPFGSVKEAIQLFGQKMDCKIQKKPSTIKGGVSYQYQQIKEDLIRHKEKLCSVEASTADTLDELNKAKNLIQLWSKARESFNSNSQNLGLPLHFTMSKDCQEVPQLNTINKPLFVISDNLQLENTEVKENLLKSNQLQCRHISVQTDEMQSEVLQTPNSSVSDSLLEGPGGQPCDSIESDTSHAIQKFVMPCHGFETENNTPETPEVNSLEMKITHIYTEIEKVKRELADVRDLEMKAFSQVVEYKQEVGKTTSALEQAKTTAQNYTASSTSISEEMDIVKARLFRVTQDGAPLGNAIDKLKSDMENVRSDLEKARQKDKSTYEALSSLQNELHTVRNTLMTTQANAANARDLKLTLPLEIKRVAAEADAAKALTSFAKEELRRTQNEIEQAKAATAVAACKLRATEGETKAAHVSESMALAGIKAISESEDKVSFSGIECDGNKLVMISLEEYTNLTNIMTTTMESANQRVSKILANVDAAKTSLKETKTKLDSAFKETEAAQKAMQQAERKAEKAQEAKLAIEAELRQWRSKLEQNRKSLTHPLSISTTSFTSPQFPDENLQPTSQWKDSFHEKPVVDLETLAQVLSMKIPPLEKKQSKVLEEYSSKPGNIKKRTFFSKVVTLVTSKDKFKRQFIRKAYAQKMQNP